VIRRIQRPGTSLIRRRMTVIDRGFPVRRRALQSVVLVFSGRAGVGAIRSPYQAGVLSALGTSKEKFEAGLGHRHHRFGAIIEPELPAMRYSRRACPPA